jgi:hypothetical protein
VVAGSLHLVANACLLLICCLHVALHPGRRRASALLLPVGAVLGTTMVWMVAGDAALGGTPLQLGDAIKDSFGLDFLDRVFRLVWKDPLVKIDYLLWNLLGPYRLLSQLLVAAIGAATAAIIYIHRRPAPAPERGRRPFRRTAWAVLVAGLLLPWGLEAPSEVTFLDFRVIALACILLAASIDSRLISPGRPRRALAVACGLLVLHFGIRAQLLGREARPVLALLEQAQPRGVMMTIAFQNRSQHFGKQFRLTHFLPMYYTVRQRGINTQFWGRYTEHLPIDFQPDRRPPGPGDWRPGDFSAAHLKPPIDFVLLQRADQDNGRRDRSASAVVERMLNQRARLVRCEGLWCLFQREPS